MIIYRVMNEETNEVLPDPIFGKESAIKQAQDLRKKSKDKAHFRVISSVPVFTTKEREENADIQF